VNSEQPGKAALDRPAYIAEAIARRKGAVRDVVGIEARHFGHPPSGGGRSVGEPHRLKLALNHRRNELTYPLTQPDFDRVKPIFENMDRRLRFRLQGRRRRATVGHRVVSTGAPTLGLI
jgi:hypothetical protein